jgi:BirA family biotin operon repressor/biotin-[acetyl-CoA-carboxylase] ligase
MALDLDDFYRVLRFDRIGSTNAEAKRLAAQEAPEGLLIVAAEQTEGRGRRQREWLSPPGNLYLSLLLRPDRPMPAALNVGFVAGIAVAEAIADCLPKDAEIRLKWPNDVLIGGRKVAGILLESDSLADGRVASLVVGVGVNVSNHPPEGAVSYPATSLRAAGAAAVSADDVLKAFAAVFLKHYRIWLSQGFAPIRVAWCAHAAGLGDSVRVSVDAATTLAGRFVAIDDEGALILEEASGRCRRITAGDVYLTPSKT